MTRRGYGSRIQHDGRDRLPYAARRLACILRMTFRETAEAMARRTRGGGGGPPRIAKHQGSKSPYFMQPGKRGVVVVLHRACGNRVVPKVCGEMPSRAHAKMLITQLERAESVVKDLFLEATDDGIEALEAVLAACREEVLRRGPRVHEGGDTGPDGGEPESEGRGAPRSGRVGRKGRRPPRGRRSGPRFDQPSNPLPLAEEPPRPAGGDEPYNEAAS